MIKVEMFRCPQPAHIVAHVHVNLNLNLNANVDVDVDIYIELG